MKKITPCTFPSYLLIYISIFLGSPWVFAEAEPVDEVIFGAGAHFAWVVFDELKDDLERVSGKKVELHGQNSALGMGCNAGIKIAMQNSAEKETFGFVCCPLDKKEVEEKQLLVHPIALEPVLIVVNRDNPVRNLSAGQTRSIFRGEITNWKDVGGNDESIVVVTRLHCKKRPGHWKTILPGAVEFRETRLSVSSAAEMEKRVNAFPNAIGHIGSTWNFSGDTRLVSVTIDGVAPTSKGLASGKYPFFRNLSAVTNRTPSPDVMKIIEEVQKGKSMRMIAKKYELLPLH